MTSAALHVSSSSASASLVTYAVTFASPDRITHGSVATVTFPAGTVLPSGGCGVVDWTDDTNGSGGCADYSATGTTATIVNMLTNPGDVVTLTFAGVTSPAGTGSHNVTLSTTADPKPVTLSYTLVAKRAVTNPFLQLSSYTAGTASTTWSIGFTAPDRLIGNGNGGSSSTVTLVAPTGTVFPSGGCSDYTIIDAGPAASQGPLSGCSARHGHWQDGRCRGAVRHQPRQHDLPGDQGGEEPGEHDHRQRVDQFRPQDHQPAADRPHGDDRHRPAQLHFGRRRRRSCTRRPSPRPGRSPAGRPR